MAAGQQKRRLNAVNLATRNVPEQHREQKKKDLELPPPALRLNPCISLEWNEKQKIVVARKDQVAISWRYLFPFVDATHRCHCLTSLADIMPVPQEIFELENLQGVLSYEGWKICLSESERTLLSKFLPKGMEVDQIIRTLLNGENFHFGNPFLEWSSLLCSGNAHPDAVIKKERSFKANKSDYYLELQKYHNNLLEDLQRLKEILTSCEEPGNIQRTLRHLKKNRDDSFGSHAHDSRLKLKDKLAPSTDSYSSTGDENYDISDESHEDSRERLIMQQGGRSISTSKIKKRGRNLAEEDRWVETSSQASDPDALSCSKIRTEHQMVKKGKQTSGLVKFKSLNRVLGDTKKLEEEEKKKLHEHWSRIAGAEISAAYARQLERRIQINRLVTLVGQEIGEKFRLMINEVQEEESEDNIVVGQQITSDDDSDIAVQNYEQEETVTSSGGHQALERTALNEHEPDITSEKSEDNDSSSDMEFENNEAVLGSTHHHSLAWIPLRNSHKNEFVCEELVEGVTSVADVLTGNSEINVSGPSVVSMAAEKNSDEPCIRQCLPEFLEYAKSNENAAHNRGASEDVWSGMSKAGISCYEESQDCIRSNKLSIGQNQPVQGQPTLVKENILRDEHEQAILCEHDADVGSSMQADSRLSLFHAYADGGQSRSINTPHLKMQHSYPPLELVDRMARQELNFLMTSNNQSEGFCYSQHLDQQQQQMLEQREAQEKELYAIHLIGKNMYEYANKGPNHEACTVPTGSVDWETNPTRVLPIQSSATGEMLDHHWGSCESRAHASWSSLEIPVSSQGQCPGNGNVGGDSLLGFMPQWNGLRQSSYNSVRSDQYVTRSAYAGGTVSQGNEIHCEGHGAQFGSSNQPFNYMMPPVGNNQHKANSSMAWINMPLAAGMSSGLMHQSSVMHDAMGRPFLGSWNQ